MWKQIDPDSVSLLKFIYRKTKISFPGLGQGI
jgi:hypothetical protein